MQRKVNMPPMTYQSDRPPTLFLLHSLDAASSPVVLHAIINCQPQPQLFGLCDLQTSLLHITTLVVPAEVITPRHNRTLAIRQPPSEIPHDGHLRQQRESGRVDRNGAALTVTKRSLNRANPAKHPRRQRRSHGKTAQVRRQPHRIL